MVELRFHGHACWEVRTDAHRLLVDPFLSGNELADVGPGDFAQLDALLISHGHGDHIGDGVQIGKKTGALVVSNYEIANWFEARGCRSHGMHLGGAHDFPFGRVKLTPAFHGSTGPDGEPLGNPAGFVLALEDKRIYHAGDTALFSDMQLIAEMEGPLDVALLPIGDNFTMGLRDAARAAKFLQARMTIPMHYDTFEVIRADPNEFVRHVREQGGQAQVVAPGDAYRIP